MTFSNSEKISDLWDNIVVFETGTGDLAEKKYSVSCGILSRFRIFQYDSLCPLKMAEKTSIKNPMMHCDVQAPHNHIEVSTNATFKHLEVEQLYSTCH